jgi:GT2 family glycosyltransferase
VDNNSSDNSIEIMKAYGHHENYRIVVNEKNLGYAAGNNVGMQIARGKYIVLLNNDTEVSQNWLEQMVAAMETDPSLGACQSKLIIMDTDYLDSTGTFLNQYGFLVHTGLLEKDSGQYDEKKVIFGAKGASMMIRKSVIEHVGMFDEDFFMYFEETDLCWRIWLAGYKIMFIPGSLVYHSWGGTTRKSANRSYLGIYLGFRNRLTSLIKNLDGRNMRAILPKHILACVVMSSFFLVRGEFRNSYFVLKALFWNLQNYQNIRKKRLKIQSSIRKVTDDKLFRDIMHKQDLFKLYRYHAQFVPENLRKIRNL